MPKTTTKNSSGGSSSKAPSKSGSTNSATKSSTRSNSGSKGKSAKQQEDQAPMLKEFFTTSLKDIYYAEKAMLKNMPKMQKAATTEDLKQSFANHVEVTREQVARLERVFESIGARAQGKKCEAMEGLIKESQEAIEDTEKGSLTRDVALIVAAQKAEHYEIASYGGLAQLARTLGFTEAADLLAQTLEEEKQADAELTTVAENNINVEASQEDESEEDK